MAVAEEIESPPPLPSGSGRMSRTRERICLSGLLALLAAFTLTTMDGGDLAPRLISGVFLVLAAAFLSIPFAQSLRTSLPMVCLLTMPVWGALQTLLSPQKIVANGWNGVLFWFTAAMITVIATQLFQSLRLAVFFRRAFMFFAGGVCLLDLLEQSSHTSSYYWLIPSRYHAVFGPFAYWNNFAQLVELALPITLLTGFAKRRSSPVPYFLMAALEVCAVVASGSRAGAVLVLAELLVVVTLVYLKKQDRRILIGAGLAIGLSLVFVYAAGFGTLIQKLQQNDQLAVRRSINQSSLEMIRERPLFGWGLDTYVPVYRMFAHYDDGTYVNRAHNDWLQWAAEGGIPFAAIMLVIFAWSVKPAIQSIWGVGLIAIGLHALVDYPFARFGVCGWYFALLPILSLEIAERKQLAAKNETSEPAPASSKEGEA